MNTKKATKRALLTSVMALVMCVVMLVGTTFAWFTDTASTGVNKIQAGNLKMEVTYKNTVGGNFEKVNKETLVFNNGALWEPGHVEFAVLNVKNTGSLALKYKLGINIVSETGSTNVNGYTFKLSDYIKFAVIEGDATENGIERAALVAAAENAGSKLINEGYSKENNLNETNDADTVTLVVWMPETVGNEANHAVNADAPVISLGINAFATQYTHENDSFDNQYDKDAPYETVKVSNEKELRTALFNAPTDGSGVKIVLQDDITLDLLYAAPNLPSSDVIQDYEAGDTLNRYKKGVHPTAEDPNHWNTLVTNQTDEEKAAYGAYYHMGANDERIARLVVKANQDVIIDLNGHNLSKDARATHGDWSNTCTDIIANYGKLKVTDSVGTGVVMGHGYNSCNGAVLHNYGGTIIVENVKVDGNAAGMTAGTGQYVIVNDGGATIIDGANIYDTLATVDASLLVNTAGTMTIKGNATLNHPNTKNINVKGGEVFVESATIISDKYAIYAKGGTVTVTTSAVHIHGNGTMKEAGGTINRK